MSASERLDALGYDDDWARELAEQGEALEPARVAIEHQDRYTLVTAEDEVDASLSGRLIEAARHGDVRPAVGDWVGVSATGAIAHLCERRTAFRRQAAGQRLAAQTVAANVDTVFIVTSCNRELSERRIERYLAAVCDSGARPVVVLNKIDLAESVERYVDLVAAIALGVDVAPISATEGLGTGALLPFLGRGQTVAMVGSSGVGKSTIGNWLLGHERLAVGTIRDDDDKGRHTTTRRELMLLPDDRGVLIDTPGMRELALWLDDGALDRAFPDITELAGQCRFRDCSHTREPGCAVRDEVAAPRLASYQRLLSEVAEARRPGRRPPRAR